MFSVNLHEFKPIQAMDCINLNMIINKYEVLPGLIGAEKALLNDVNNSDLLNLLRWTQKQELELIKQLYSPQWQSI